MLYHILLGGNLGNRLGYFARAKQLLAQISTIIAESKYYETAAWGVKNQPDYLNQALAVESDLSPKAFLMACLQIEDALGRTRLERWGARTMDIDLLLAQEEVWDLPELQIPHPRLHLRRFALLPLCDIAAEAVHPISNRKIADILAMCTDTAAVNLFEITPI